MLINMKNVLIVASHIDDESFGMGGAICKHTQAGDIVDVLTLTDSCSTQYKNKDWKKILNQKKKESQNAMDILGVRKIELNSLPDMKLDIVAHVDVNNIISKKIESFDPDVVYTHFRDDLNSDHRCVFESTMVSCRPIQSDLGSSNRKIISYEVPSCTEWGWNAFKPNMYVELTPNLVDKKMQAITYYESEIRDWPHPRSPDAVMYQMKHYGSTCGCYAAERFQIIREIL